VLKQVKNKILFGGKSEMCLPEVALIKSTINTIGNGIQFFASSKNPKMNPKLDFIDFVMKSPGEASEKRFL
jgi:hypothetical protein